MALNITQQIHQGRPGARVIDLSNTRSTRRPLSNGDVLERVAKFLRTGNKNYLPLELRPEADGIVATVLAAQCRPEPPWPSTSAKPYPGPGATISEQVRALIGDERADAPSGFEDDDPPRPGRGARKPRPTVP